MHLKVHAAGYGPVQTLISVYVLPDVHTTTSDEIHSIFVDLCNMSFYEVRRKDLVFSDD